MVDSLIRAAGAGFFHGPELIFRDVSFEVFPGRAFCLLGPNGSGKTTLIHTLLGIEALDQGDIFLGGKPVTSLSPGASARILAYVPQDHDRHFSFTVLEVLLMGRTPYTRFYAGPGAEARDMAEALLDSMGLIHLRDRDYTRLSGGETRLVMILRALIQETPVIVMDEPTAHLDFRNELLVLETIVRLVRERGITLVMATHFPNHAFYLESAGVPVEVAFMGCHGLTCSGPPSSALTRENLETFYGVHTWVADYPIPGRGRVRQIIPLETKENAP